MTNEVQLKPYKHQMAFLKAMAGGTRRALLKWHRRAGKDVICFAFMIEQMIKIPGNYYYFLDTYAQAKKVIWEAPFQGGKLLDLIPAKLIKNMHRSELKIELINGSILRLIGADTLDRLRGVDVQGVVLSEYAFADTYPALWLQMEPVIIRNKGWAIINSTPKGRNHFYHLEQAIKGNPNWYYSHIQTTKPNEPNYTGIMTPEEIEGARISAIASEEVLGMDPDEYIEQEYGASTQALVSGAYFQANIQEARSQGRIGAFPVNRALWVDTYWDIGGRDDVTCWFIQHIDGIRRVVDYHESAQKDIAFYVQMLQSRGLKYREHIMPWDAAASKGMGGSATSQLFQQALESAGVSGQVRVIKRMPVQDGINALRAIFHTFYFNEETTHKGIKHLELHKRKFNKMSNTFSEGKGAHDKHSHAVDSFRLIAAAGQMNSDWPLDKHPTNMLYYNSFDPFTGNIINNSSGSY